MTIKEFINKAIEGGWKPNKVNKIIGRVAIGEIVAQTKRRGGKGNRDLLPLVLIDPKAWEAVGKAEKWADYEENHYEDRRGDLWSQTLPIVQSKMRGMIDALIEGKTLEQYIETL